jgi:hypothetical protein
VQKPVKAEPDDGFPVFNLDIDDPLYRSNVESRHATLRIDTKTLTVHHVKAVAFKTDSHSVKRHRSTKRAADEF